MTREEAIKEINRVFEPAYANYIVVALTEGATVSDVEKLPYFNSQEPCDDAVSRKALLEFFKDDDYVVNEINNMPSVIPKREQGEWIYTPERHIVDETDEEVVYETENRCSCSACGHKYGFIKIDDAYCRYCGAEMR